MSTADLLVIGILAAVAGLPALSWVWQKSKSLVPSTVKPDASAWKQHWVETLIQLQGELETRPEQAESVKLVRQLIWLLVGGEPMK